MVCPLLPDIIALVPVDVAHGVTPGGLIFVAILSFGTVITGMVLGHFVIMGPTVACVGETDVWV